ncbi:SCP2 sterol-binding domain-containing protein [Ochrobactrum sp. Marseille-Q0166]|uniref:ubiquinone anaerobic biosynthesis accessory factor UbiT n=1 Tax=Ochrobactrum sp. Marseille-Q0166 TaxID=2761105 RepID=UPI001655DF3B|nr:SCP2 sterol-binding domain-containing protein [Ochrobactrum sp. Marseille-Q0166]MBC8719853.1 SCP2 sterol-binding domain-containing protein [Ochrobactrum sp. Marseille-Q0166]
MMKIPPVVAASVRLVPPFLLTSLVSRVFLQVICAHPGLFERMGDYVDKRFGFSPLDLPFMFVVEPARSAITVMRKDAAVETDAAIDGPLIMLLALLEGKLDGDALFFSRDITVTGDMEAMLALRNALDDCNVDLPADLSKAAGPFAPIIKNIGVYVRDKMLNTKGSDHGEGTWN